MSAIAALAGVAIASVPATENALVIRDRAAPPAASAAGVAQRTHSTWQQASMVAEDGVLL